jgi:hypothetical protein
MRSVRGDDGGTYSLSLPAYKPSPGWSGGAEVYVSPQKLTTLLLN